MYDSKYNILVCDDDRDIVNALKIYLTSEGYNIYEAFNGKEAIDIVKKNDIQLVLIDIMMPVMDGISATSQLREISNIPVIFLTAKSEDTDKILGLNIGADDYITKPFNPVEVIARVKSQLRRYVRLGGIVQKPSQIQIGGITLDDDSKVVTVDGDVISLTPIEYEILKLLMGNSGKVYSSSQIYNAVWNDNPYGAENTVAVHIRHLREKIEITPAEPRYLKVVWGQGYKIDWSESNKK